MTTAAAHTRRAAAARRRGGEPTHRSLRREQPSGDRSATRLERLSLGGSVAGFLLLCWLLRRFVTDDAWITIRYAQNLADGHGLVWNPGGPRVEGFSNPLLVGAEALAHVAGVPAIDVARAIGVLAGVGVLVLIHRAAPPVVWPTAT